MFGQMAILAVALAAALGAQPSFPAAEIDRLLQPFAQRSGPGVVVGVVQDGRFVYQRAAGLARLDPPAPLNVEASFPAASLAKQFTAYLILKLEQQGRLRLDDPIRKHLPEFPDFEPAPRIRHLLSHTDGIRDFHWLNNMRGLDIRNDYSPQDVLALLCRQRRLNFEPGTEFSYGNSGYFVLWQIAERTGGQSLDRLARMHIFGPLGMSGAQMREVVDPIPEVPLAYEGGLPLKNRDRTLGSKGLLISLEDLRRWHEHLQRPGDLEWRLMTVAAEQNGYALGLMNVRWRGYRLIDHSGAYSGYTSRAMLFPAQRLSVIAFSNDAAADAHQLAEQVAELILPPLKPPAPSKPETFVEPTVQVSTEQMEPWVGRYFSPEVDAEHLITLEEDGLVLTVGRHRHLLQPLKANEFRCALGRIVFDAEGFEIYGTRVRQIGFRRR